MKLTSFEYSEFVGTPQAWHLSELTLGQKTLLVGKNASGKSRTLAVINSLANALSGLPGLGNGNFHAVFTHEGTSYVYDLAIANQEVTAEALSIGGKVQLERGTGGVGQIWADQIADGSYIKFQSPTSDIAAVARRDSIQHGFLEPLYNWAAAIRHHQFGTNLGKDHFAFFTPGGAKVDDRIQQAVVAIFRDAKKNFDRQFTDAVIADMAQVGYDLEDVDLGPPISIQIPANAPSGVVALFVKERDLPGLTDQVSMSQGMFRVLSLLISVNNFVLKHSGACLLVDDIGEGLDFDRSCRLIKLLRQKAETSNLQIVLATNDRFVMNEVPLEEWSFLQRTANRVQVRNITNSRKIFEEFLTTGLSNFSFLEFDVINQASDENRQNA
jgi:energy-coupling factor transporter ATP-binding protein EcfA2